MMELIFHTLGAACATYLWATSEPTVRLRKWAGLTTAHPNRWVRAAARASECCLCSGVYIGALATLDPFAACVCSVAAEMIYRSLNKF